MSSTKLFSSLCIALVMLCSCVAACGHRSTETAIPFGQLDQASLQQIYSICPPEQPAKGSDPRADGMAAIPKAFQHAAGAPIAKRCGHFENTAGFRIDIDMVRDDQTGQVLSFSLQFSLPDGADADKAKVIDETLKKTVDPWLKVATPAAVRHLLGQVADTDSESSLNGPSWLVRASATRGDGMTIVSLDARLVEPED